MATKGAAAKRQIQSETAANPSETKADTGETTAATAGRWAVPDPFSGGVEGEEAKPLPDLTLKYFATERKALAYWKKRRWDSEQAPTTGSLVESKTGFAVRGPLPEIAYRPAARRVRRWTAAEITDAMLPEPKQPGSEAEKPKPKQRAASASAVADPLRRLELEIEKSLEDEGNAFRVVHALDGSWRFDEIRIAVMQRVARGAGSLFRSLLRVVKAMDVVITGRGVSHDGRREFFTSWQAWRLLVGWAQRSGEGEHEVQAALDQATRVLVNLLAETRPLLEQAATETLDADPMTVARNLRQMLSETGRSPEALARDPSIARLVRRYQAGKQKRVTDNALRQIATCLRRAAPWSKLSVPEIERELTNTAQPN